MAQVSAGVIQYSSDIDMDRIYSRILILDREERSIDGQRVLRFSDNTTRYTSNVCYCGTVLWWKLGEEVMADSLLNLQDSLAETIKENEGGLVLEPYKLEYTTRDGTTVKENVYTVGYGTQITDKEYNDYIKLNEEQKINFVNKKFTEKYEQAKIDANTYMQSYGITNAPQNVKNVIVEMAYNMGRGSAKNKKGLMSFKGFASAIKKGDFERAANELRYIDPNVPEKGETNYYKQIGPKGDQKEKDSRIGKLIQGLTTITQTNKKSLAADLAARRAGVN
jgi:GH24 family phage-related lysozyme (muramidase)